MIFILIQAEHTVDVADFFLRLSFWSVKSWTPAQILVADDRMTGRVGDTCHGTLFCSQDCGSNKGKMVVLARSGLKGAPARHI
jgi:hypothetical protein